MPNKSNEAGADRALIARWIKPERAYPGDPEARVVDTDIPVWALVGHFKANGEDAGLTAADYRLPPEAIKAALAYYRKRREIIDARLMANDTANGS